MKQAVFILGFSATFLRAAEGDASATPTEKLPEYLVYSTRVALQEPSATFAMPVSALRFEPLVDVQARNLAEGQADVTIRGGTFENTGFKIGALSMYDPITGHYFAEIPVAPAMLSMPTVLLGYDNALRSWNATTGTVAYQWRPIRTSGALTLSAGDYATHRGEVYQGWVSPVRVAGRVLAMDATVASSRSDGSRPWGEHAFDRTNVRLQLAGRDGQTDLFYGYQAKAFGWPNLYTPYAGINELDQLQTALFVLNHRQALGGEDFVQVGAHYRRNKDHYIFNRQDAFNPAFPFGPSRHTAWTTGLGAEGQVTRDEIVWQFQATAVADKIRSTSLNFGPSRARDQYRAALSPKRTWDLADGRKFAGEVGLAYDGSSRGAHELSPSARLTLDGVAPTAGLNSIFLSYAQSTQLPTYTALNSRASAGLFRGNAKLGRSIARTLELGAQGGGGRWSWQGAVFYRRDEELVDWTFASAVPNARAANAVDLDNLGAELVARYSLASLDLTLGYTALSKDADYGTALVDASFYALNFAKHRATAAVTWRVGRGWEVRVDNEYRIQEKDTLRRSAREAHLTSAGVYFAPSWVPGLRLGAEVENAWDDDFQEVPAVPSARRQFSGGLTYVW